MRHDLAPAQPGDPSSDPEDPIEVILAEIREVSGALELPDDFRKEAELAVALFLETNPLMREKIDALRARSVNRSATVAVRRGAKSASDPDAGVLETADQVYQRLKGA
ncbi:MAG: hypothetical protein HOV80_22810 [Polyangiaceae bacterium]|nr:hypothetical protein [Polyangiaceae bacterium]